MKTDLSETVALRCPSCGSAETIGACEVRFGFHFTCQHCKASSVLIVGRQLYVPRPGEHICIECGQVAPRDARYCQCGRNLVHKCSSRFCEKEIPIEHGICNSCGWPQSLAWDSPEGAKRELEIALIQLQEGKYESLSILRQIAPPKIAITAFLQYAKDSKDSGGLAYEAEAYKLIGKYAPEDIQSTAGAVDAIVGKALESQTSDNIQRLRLCGSAAIPALIGILQKAGVGVRDALSELRNIGPEASTATDALIPFLTSCCGSEAFLTLRSFGSNGVSALPALLDCIWDGKNRREAIDTVANIGPAAIPYLKQFTGWFKDRTRREVAELLIEKIRKENS